MKLAAHRYGKSRIRVLKILRAGPAHTVVELEIDVALEGDFAASYVEKDNRKVVATDTIKNTVNILAKKHLGEEIERFGIVLAEHFLERYPQVGQASVTLRERDWQRMNIGGQPHPHSFSAGSEARRTARVVCTRESQLVTSGIRDLVLLKSTESGFENFLRDEFTTLPETAERILATSFTATWNFRSLPANFRQVNETILAGMLGIFATHFSASAQATLYEMGAAALAVCPEIASIDLAMPNKHYLLINLAPFGLENKNDLFLPTDEPHGQIEATVTRDD